MLVASMPSRRLAASDRLAQPFESAAAAWLWTMSALRARHEGARSRGGGRGPRPCDPDDVVVSLDRLLRSGRIGPRHLRVLRVWGLQGVTPESRLTADRTECALWREAMERLAPPLRAKGIVSSSI